MSDCQDTPRTDAVVRLSPASKHDNLATPVRDLIDLCRKLERECNFWEERGDDLASRLEAALVLAEQWKGRADDAGRLSSAVLGIKT
jgi:hypothetical protein